MSRAHEQREQHLHRDGDAELLEELAGNGGHEARRHEHRNDGQADRDDRQADLVGRLERRLIRRFAHPDMAHDILDLDDRVVDEDAGAERDRQQAHHIEREAEDVHDPERRQDRQRQGDRGDDGRPQSRRNRKHHDHGERGAFVERMHAPRRSCRACR